MNTAFSYLQEIDLYLYFFYYQTKVAWTSWRNLSLESSQNQQKTTYTHICNARAALVYNHLRQGQRNSVIL